MEAITDRKKALLRAIIREHIRQADPVGSAALVDKYGLNVSPATVRNEMAELEGAGYIAQPHTSAGRVPTEKGWRFYLNNLFDEKPLTDKVKEHLQGAFGVGDSTEGKVKNLAKSLADLSRDAVIVGFAPADVYYTGLSNLFAQPEFSEIDLIQDISRVIDHLDEVMERLFPSVQDDVRILIGHDNPFGQECGTVLVRYRTSAIGEGMFGILGPVRMPYDEHVGLVKFAKGLIERSV